MWLAKLKCWAMVIIAAVVVGLSVSCCLNTWMPCCSMDWLKWSVYLMCAIIGVAYIVKYALILKGLGKEQEE